MKIVHTADWHIGKIVNERSMLEDQMFILDQWLEKTQAIAPDVVLIAGDLYDRSLPGRDSVNLANQILTKMVQQLNCPICIIAGNHDSGERIAYASQLLESQQLYMVGLPTEEVQRVTVGNADIYMLPFADHATLRHVLKNDSIHSIADATQVQVDQIKRNWRPDRINILMFHGYVTNADLETSGSDLEYSDSERPLSIGTAEYVPCHIFDGFDYVALGHLHAAQKVGKECIRYSGSPLKYSKSEVHQKKQFLEIDIDKQLIAVTKHVLLPKRDMRTIRGDFTDLMQGGSGDYVFIELTDKTAIHEGMNRLRKNFPQAMSLAYPNLETMQRTDALLQTRHSEPHSRIDEGQLFAGFYQEMYGEPLTAAQSKIVEQIFREVKEG